MKIYLILLMTFTLAFCKQKDHTADEQAVKSVIDSFYYSVISANENPVSVDTMSIRFIASDVAIVNVADKTGMFFSPEAIRGKENAVRTMRRFVIVKKDGKWMMKQNQNTVVN